jgi:hypothetical protein
LNEALSIILFPPFVAQYRKRRRHSCPRRNNIFYTERMDGHLKIPLYINHRHQFVLGLASSSKAMTLPLCSVFKIPIHDLRMIVQVTAFFAPFLFAIEPQAGIRQLPQYHRLFPSPSGIHLYPLPTALSPHCPLLNLNPLTTAIRLNPVTAQNTLNPLPTELSISLSSSLSLSLSHTHTDTLSSLTLPPPPPDASFSLSLFSLLYNTQSSPSAHRSSQNSKLAQRPLLRTKLKVRAAEGLKDLDKVFLFESASSFSRVSPPPESISVLSPRSCLRLWGTAGRGGRQ